jgi:hypothetical protein
MGRRAPRRTGRPPAVADADRVTRLLEAVSAGVPITQACHYAGIHPASHHRAIAAADAADQAEEAGEDPGPAADVYRDYRDRFTRARAEVAVVHVALVAKAARGGQVVRQVTRTEPDGTVHEEVERARPEWKASAWLLSKSFPADLGDRRSVEVSGPDGGPVRHAPAEDVLVTLAERLQEVRERHARELPGGWDAEQPAAAPRVIGEDGRAVDGPR